MEFIEHPTFNLWTEPWITIERHDGSLEEISVKLALETADSYRTVYDPSPLVVFSIHRWLVAILQAIIQPQSSRDLKAVWRNGFPLTGEKSIQAFGERYRARFDLFSTDVPFLQSADMPIYEPKKANRKSVGYLFHDDPPGTVANFFNHQLTDSLIYCAKCTAKGLVTVPAYSLSGGSGNRPSINTLKGIAPLYLLPGGKTYFQSLTASLTRPNYQPDVADHTTDTPWWQRNSIVKKGQKITKMGYLYSLTMPTRRVRLHPESMRRPCSRCGQQTDWGCATMHFQMGEWYPKDTEYPFWRDPFVAYRKPKPKKDGSVQHPTPIVSITGRAVWREFAGLFLPDETGGNYLRPRLLAQLHEELEDVLPYDDTYPMRVIGFQTDNMKVAYWEEHGFLVPPRIFNDLVVADKVEKAIEFAIKSESYLKSAFKDWLSGKTALRDAKLIKGTKPIKEAIPVKGSEQERRRMLDTYWQRLGDQFRQFILHFDADADVEQLFSEWVQTVINIGINCFREVAESLNRGNSNALICEQAINHCRTTLYNYRNRTYPHLKKEVSA